MVWISVFLFYRCFLYPSFSRRARIQAALPLMTSICNTGICHIGNHYPQKAFPIIGDERMQTLLSFQRIPTLFIIAGRLNHCILCGRIIHHFIHKSETLNDTPTFSQARQILFHLLAVSRSYYSGSVFRRHLNNIAYHIGIRRHIRPIRSREPRQWSKPIDLVGICRPYLFRRGSGNLAKNSLTYEYLSVNAAILSVSFPASSEVGVRILIWS